MLDPHLPKQISQLQAGQEAPGGQKKRSKDNVESNLNKLHIICNNWEDIAKNRTTWRNRVLVGAALLEEDL